MKKEDGKIKLELKRSTIREAIEMGDMMMSSGALYDEHPIVKLFNEILDEVQTITVKAVERKH